jgi:hypothetical protein
VAGSFGSVTGTGIKAHHFFAVGLSKNAHFEFDADHEPVTEVGGVALWKFEQGHLFSSP